MIYSDDPELDFLRWDAKQIKEQAEYDRGCLQCIFCHQAIRPYEDPNCYQLYEDAFLHPACLNEMIKIIDRRLEHVPMCRDLFELMADAYKDSDTFLFITPDSVEGGY